MSQTRQFPVGTRRFSSSNQFWTTMKRGASADNELALALIMRKRLLVAHVEGIYLRAMDQLEAA